MSSHAPLAPSASHRWTKCPGSVALCADIPDESSDHSKQGTFAHDVAALCLESNLEAADLVGYNAEVEGNHYELDDEMAGYVQSYLDVCAAYAEGDALTFIETKVKLHGLKDVYGTADFIAATEHELDVVDFKYGAGVYVPVEENPQLRIYASGAVDLLTKKHKVEPEFIRCHIVQPRHYLAPGDDGHSVEELHIGELVEWRAWLIDRVQATKDPDAPLIAGDHCRWCLAKHKCPVLREHAVELAQDVFADEAMTVPKAPPAPTELSNQQISQILEATPRVEEWIKAIRSEAYDRANAGASIPGYKIVEKTGHRKWVDEKDVRQAFEEKGKDPHVAKLKSPNQAEKDLGKALVAKLAVKPVTGTVLVPESDPRPTMRLEDVFHDETEPETK